MTLRDWVAIGVALANVAVAAMTLYLALKTRALAKESKAIAVATSDEARTVRQSLETSIRPWLTRPAVPLGSHYGAPMIPAEHFVTVNQSDDVLRVVMYMRNVGNGIALIEAGDDFRIEGRDREGNPVSRAGFAEAAALPPDESTRMTFVIQRVHLTHFLSMHRNDGEFWVWVPYTDTSGGQATLARAHVTRVKASGKWTFHQIHYYRLAEEEPFAQITFDAATIGGPET